MKQSFPANLAGAVDLSALAAAKSATAAPQPSNVASGQGTGESNTVAGSVVREITEANLRQTLESSLQVPFIFAFHSAHSPNSEKLVGVLRKIAQEFQGRFGLALVSTDTQAQVAQAFGVSAVPAAIAILQGQPIPLFQGLPTDLEIQQTVEKLLTAAAQYGITGVLAGAENSADSPEETAEKPLSPLHEAGLTALNNGDLPAAQVAYEKALKENPNDTEAHAALQQVQLLQRMETLNPARDAQLAQQILEKAAQAPLEEIAPHLDAADIEMAYARPDAAFARLIDVIAATAGEQRDLVRQRLLSLFATLGNEDELVKQARRALANVLF